MTYSELKPVYAEELPSIENGFLYISKKYNTASHNCPCGCGSLIVTPLKKTGWHLAIDMNDKISLRPSISNPTIPCKSHYWITDNKILWAEEPRKIGGDST